MLDSWFLRKRVEARILALALAGQDEPEPQIDLDMFLMTSGIPVKVAKGVDFWPSK